MLNLDVTMIHMLHSSSSPAKLWEAPVNCQLLFTNYSFNIGPRTWEPYGSFSFVRQCCTWCLAILKPWSLQMGNSNHSLPRTFPTNCFICNYGFIDIAQYLFQIREKNLWKFCLFWEAIYMLSCATAFNNRKFISHH